MDDRQLREKVMVLIGTASTCWKGGTGDSEFESDRAVALGEEFIAELRASPYLPETRGELSAVMGGVKLDK